MTPPTFADPAAYERYVGRWSRSVAPEFLAWLGVPAHRRWLDVGCGTGALTETVLALSDPEAVTGVDPSASFVADAAARVTDPRAGFRVGDARALPLADSTVDAVVSALVLNFVPEPAVAVAEFARVTRPGGLAAAYVWDYAQGMGLIRHFWDAAVLLDPAAAELDEGRRMPVCAPDPLRALWTDAGFTEVRTEALVIQTPFADFADYWEPFLGGQGPAPGYVRSLGDVHRSRLRDLLASRLPVGPDGTIPLTARAWAVRGRR
ncbi:class I SAM-dependent methyltransferase [Catellatospora sp. KI3]|uniref:class I SAM-dependent methyltransferase n=1 Tax=Catellatospora sp. KI3 TaxID=3041620 RepID=UPI0024822C80|nr:class I SAM-dependent methyltransferase [Catellatospora sp. KI3]MDI1461307.1 class I SAM-dependent methyltransferase [Catellatospora sp. KI3]